MATATQDKAKVLAEGNKLLKTAEAALGAYMKALELIAAANVRLGKARKRAKAAARGGPAKRRAALKAYEDLYKKEQRKVKDAKRKAAVDAKGPGEALEAFAKKHRKLLTSAPQLQDLARTLRGSKAGFKALERLRQQYAAERKKASKKTTKKTTKKSSKKTTSR